MDRYEVEALGYSVINRRIASECGTLGDGTKIPDYTHDKNLAVTAVLTLDDEQIDCFVETLSDYVDVTNAYELVTCQAKQLCYAYLVAITQTKTFRVFFEYMDVEAQNEEEAKDIAEEQLDEIEVKYVEEREE